MKILVLGGTEFVGRHFVGTALVAGHEITLFNRGRRNPHLFPGVEKITGDRRQSLDGLLGGRYWDSILDTSGYLPSVVANSARALQHRAAHYTFISTVSVYHASELPISELSEVKVLAQQDLTSAESLVPGPCSTPGGGYGSSYGALKAQCERECQSVFAGRNLIIRPGVIAGRWDYSGRFTYWVERLRRGGATVAPGSPSRPLRLLDVRDLAEWILRLIEQDVAGIYNATGQDNLSMGSMLKRISDAVSHASTLPILHWVPDHQLTSAGMRPMTSFPFWVTAENAMSLAIGNNAAVGRGLRFRSIADSAADVAEWIACENDAPIAGGLSQAEEMLLLSTVPSPTSPA